MGLEGQGDPVWQQNIQVREVVGQSPPLGLPWPLDVHTAGHWDTQTYSHTRDTNSLSVQADTRRPDSKTHFWLMGFK